MAANKRKLDLNGLLSKYEGLSQTHTAGYQDFNRYEEPVRTSTVNNDFYRSRNVNIVEAPETVTYAQTTNFVGNFQMSKGQCEQFLLGVKQTLRDQERQLQGYAENAHIEIHRRFQANHQRIKREILDLLDKAFAENERYITEELKRQGSGEPVEFVQVHKRISSIDEDINRLLYGLKGVQYRKSIAETVLKDYTSEIADLKQNVQVAKDNYLASLGEVEPDISRIDCIRQDLQRLFKISKKNTAFIQETIFNALTGSRPNPENSQVQVQKEKQRKSFFNFGGI